MVAFGEGVVHWPTVFSLSAFPVIVVAYTLWHGGKSAGW